MPKASLEYNNFSVGLITEASDVAQPDTCIRSMSNFDLQSNGSATLRAPLQREVNSPTIMDVSGAAYTAPASAYVWHAPDGDQDVDIVFLQYGDVFKVFRRAVGIGSSYEDITPATATHCTDNAIGVTATYGVNVADDAAMRCSFASTQSWCSVTGLSFTLGSTVHNTMVGIFTYDKQTQELVLEYDFLWVRDFWGVYDGRVNGQRVTSSGMDINVAYNLFNRGWYHFVDGAKPAAYVINKFYADSDTTNTDAICAAQTPTASAYLTIDGDETSGGQWIGAYPSRVRIATSTAVMAVDATFLVSGLDHAGNTASDYVSVYDDDFGASIVGGETATSLSVVTSVQCISNVAANAFVVGTGSAYPGNRDNWALGVALNGVSKQYNAKHVVQSPDIVSEAPVGHYVIPAHNRSYQSNTFGLSRNSAAGLYSSVFGSGAGTLPADVSGRPHGAAAWAGRLWYGTSLVGGDEQAIHKDSPSIGGYVFFSRIVQKAKDAISCYQANDPTSATISDILADDGGHVYIPDMGDLQALASLQGAMLVLASNGVWAIIGDRDSGFSATSYSRIKISSRGCVSPGSVISTGSAVFFCSSDGIEMVAVGEGGQLQLQSLTHDKNSKYVRENVSDFSSVQGYLDYTSSKLRYLLSGTKELAISVDTGAVEIHDLVLGDYDIACALQFYGDFSYKFSGSIITAPSYLYVLRTGDDLVTGQLRYDDYSGELFQWEDLGGEYGSISHVTLAHIVAGDSKLIKRAPFITAHFKRTESHVEVDEVGDARLIRPSGCNITCYWGWADSAASPLRAADFQAYRLTTSIAPPETAGTYEYAYGQSVITSKSALRGYGRALSVAFKAQANKDCHILGWALPVQVPYNPSR